MNRKLNRDQRAILKDFCETYDFSENQIGFDSDSTTPIFDFDALSVLSLRLCNVPGIAVSFVGFENANMATSSVTVRLANGAVREFFAVAQMGEHMHNGEPVVDAIQAVNLSRARALRVGLRAATFDPVKAHAAMKRGENVLDFTPGKFVDPGLAECHMIGEELGYIVRDGGKLVDRSTYDRLMATYFHGKTSTAALTPQERAQWAGMLRAWKSARQRKAS